jgi:hypothetical protein
MSVNIQTGNVVKIESGNRVLISAPGPQGPAGTGGTPGGTDTQVQFNDSSAFGGDAGLTYAKTTDTLTGVNQTFTGLSTLTHIHGNIAGSLYVHVKNTSGVTIAKGTPVYATGSVGSSGEVEVAAADYTNSAKMPSIGITDAQLTANAEGNAVVVGEVMGLATNSYSINQELFVGTAGLLGALPTTGEAQSIAVVSRVHASTGIIVVNAQARLNAALRALANNNGSSLTGITASQVGAIPDEPLVEITNNGTGDGRVQLWDGTNSNWQDITAIDGGVSFSGDIYVTGTVGAGNISGNNTGDLSLAGTPDYLTLTNQVLTLTAIDLAADVTGTLGVANGGTGATTLTANNVLLGNGTSAPLEVAPGASGNTLTSNGTTWTSAAPATTNPAGSGSELQFRSSGTAFGAVTNSSVSSGAITLGAAEALGTTSTARLTLANTTAAAAGAQQVSPSLVFEGQGWKTTATAASQTVRFRENVLPVQGTTNPSGTWQLQSEINNSGTWNNIITATTENSVVAFPGMAWIGGVVGSSGASDKMQIAGNLAIRATTAGSPVFRAVPSGSDIYLDASAGNMFIRINGTNQALAISTAQLQLGANTAVNSATATAQTIKGPNATGTTATGGSLTLAGGTGTSAGGAVILAASATTGAPATAVTVNNNAVTTFAKPPVLPAYTVATLPATAATGMVQGAHAIVTDATAPTYLGALTGGGAVVCPVFYDGTAWVSH